MKILKDLGVAFPVNFLSYINSKTLNPMHIFAQSVLSIVTYKTDRYLDSDLERDKLTELSLFCGYTSIIEYSIYDRPDILPLFISTFLYKKLKEDTILKSSYVSFMWAYVVNMYNLNFENFFCTFFCIFSLTNILDIKDYESDLNNNYKTLPIILGNKTTVEIAIISGILSNVIYFVNSHDTTLSITDYFFYMNNLSPIFLLNSTL